MELVRDINDNASLGRAVELGQHQAGQTEAVMKLLHLRNTVLACRGIED